jgi:hypothetical protein
MKCSGSRSNGWKQLKPYAAALLFAALGNTAFAEGDRKPAKLPIVLEATGAFEVGGRVITKPGDPSQTLSCDHGYVEYFIPVKRRSVGLIMWHSSSTKVWENRWDGGEGYKSIFLRKGYPVYLWDGPRVGRANWSCEPITYTPEYFDQRNFAAWRFGLTWPNWNPGLQFPTADQEAWNQATRARYDEFDTLENALLQAEAGGQAIDKIGPVVALTNSAGGWRALLSALEAKSGNMKGIVAYETPGFVFPEGEGPEPKPGAPFGPNSVPLAEFMKLTKFRSRWCSATTPTRVRSGPPPSSWHGPSAISSIVTEETARSCCSPMRVCAATHTSPLPISITKPSRTNYPNGCIAKAWTSLTENKPCCERCPRREVELDQPRMMRCIIGLPA